MKAKKLGLKVAVADYNPDAIGVCYADKYYNVSTVDEIGIYQVANDFCADGVITLATDMPMRAIAYTCERLGLTGITYDTSIKTTDKGEMIKAFENNGVDHPWYFILNDVNQVENIESDITYPCVSKPLDSSGSRGVVLIENKDQLRDSIKYSSSYGRSPGIIVQEFLSGKEVSVEILVQRGVVYILSITDKLTTGPPHFVEIRHSQPSMIDKEIVKRIKQVATSAVLAVDITDGPAHVEIMLTNSGPKVIELGARMGGDFIASHLVPASTGIDMISKAISIACGEKVNIVPKFERGSCIQYIVGRTGVVREVNGQKEAREVKGVIETEILKQVGDKTLGICNSHDRLGYIIGQGATAIEAIKVCEEATTYIDLEIE
ncbi:hypothetical protein BKP57_14830 [Virgibacillus sp. 6R]|nr:hypothetical protein BKP57_14830 [Virgibacillus sp. 6R]